MWITARSVLSALVATFLLTGSPVGAHHSFGVEFDADKPMTLTGVVTKVDWTNPHAYLFLDVTENGKVVNWKLEGFSTNTLSRVGFVRGVTVKPGDRVSVYGWRARDGTAYGHLREITLADGRRLFFGPGAGTGEGGPIAR